MTGPSTESTARRMWHLIETIHAIVYFAPEVSAHYEDLGLKGFWMGYFAGRAAPLGAATPELVTATFFNFHPDMVARALPDAWQIADPKTILGTRNRAVDEALQRILGDSLTTAGMVETAELLEHAVAGTSLAGRPLFAAHASLTPPTSPRLRLWHAATLIREHRGDGHIAAQLAHGFTGLDAHITLCATGTMPRPTIQPHRGWSDDEWENATQQLYERGLLDDAGSLSDAGRAARASVEERTDQLATGPWHRLGADGTTRAAELLTPIAGAVVVSGALPFPNPMGLPAPRSDRR